MSAACPRCGTSNATGRLAFCPVCALSAESETGDERASLEVPGIELESELGRGGMGCVFRGRHAALGRAVAVKVLSPEMVDDPEFRARFEREARTLARLDHPGIVRVHDFGTTRAGEHYLVMELVAGGTLAEKIPVPVERGIQFALELCDALSHAHEQGVVHRDIKPANVLVAPDGRLKLTDFGIARLFEGKESVQTTSSRVFGTPSYMAPEAMAGARADAKMDVYSVGVVLHELLTGRLPRDGRAPLPPSISRVIEKATALDPRDRTDSARALSAELRDALGRIDGDASSPDDLPDEERTWAGAVALLIAVATAVALYAFLVSFSPRSLAPEDALPMIAFGIEKLPDGRLYTQARFEVWPTLGAAISGAFALFAYGLLRRHWRRSGLDRPTPERRLPGSKRVLRLGVLLVALFVARELLVASGASGVVTYIPVLGGVLELWMLYVFFSAVLDALRTKRPLRKEPLLWLGLALSLVPPTYEFVASARRAANGHEMRAPER